MRRLSASPPLSVFGSGRLRLDERLVVAALAVIAAAWFHAASYTAAEGAHPAKRWLFRRSADAFALVACYALVRLWT
ncbi:MAG TPA: hypothetical protein VKV26_03185 [Dehalococcoidia bacterium]|nr:hypothetical protein [Dehalococcoidia bacterium]